MARQTGRCLLGDIAAFSFCQDKIRSPPAAKAACWCSTTTRTGSAPGPTKDIGRSYDAVYHRKHAPGFRWLTESFGTNWRMTEMQAAIRPGCSWPSCRAGTSNAA